MKKIFRAFVLLSFLGLFANSCFADIITSLTFEGMDSPDNDASNAFVFSNSGDSGLAVDQNFILPGSGEEVVQFQRNAFTTHSFAGGGLGVFNLAADPSFVNGSLTVADLDQLNISFDLEIVGPAPILFRLERSGFFDTALDLNITPIVDSGFQNVSVDLATLDLSERNDLVAALNGSVLDPDTNQQPQASTEIQLVFEFDVAPPAITEDNIVRIDNLFVTSVPEPSGTWLLAVCGLAYSTRRRR